MKWVTRDVVHLERVATPWLIKRFVDPDAEFVFMGWDPDEKPPADANPFAVPGTEITPHDKDGTAFRKIMTKYKLQDPALDSIDKVIFGAVHLIMYDEKPGPEDIHMQMARGLIAISEGIMLIERGDAEVIAASMPIYDALYANFRAEHLRKTPAKPEADPDRPMAQTMYVHSMTKFLRSLNRK